MMTGRFSLWGTIAGGIAAVAFWMVVRDHGAEDWVVPVVIIGGVISAMGMVAWSSYRAHH